MSEPATVFDTATACRHVFRTATAAPRLMQQEWAENRLADFNLWCAGAGAFTTGKASLDRRLRANPEARTILVNLLLMLKILIQKCIDGGREIKDSAMQLSAGELARMKDVENSLNQLTRLTVAIRKAGIRSRLQKADSTFDPDAPQIRSLRRHLELLLLVHSDEYGSSDSSARQLDPARLTPIQLRLIDANLRRRNRFLYAQQHAQKLGINSGYPKNTLSEKPALVNQPLCSDIGKIASLSQEEEILIKDDMQPQSTTTATVVDERIETPPEQVTRPVTTVVSVTSSRITYPKAPPLHDRQMLFTCPCCCQCLPAAARRGNQWKKHLMGDILPYTCIVEDCPRTGTFYMTKETWLSHMDKEHGDTEQWVCRACSQKNIHVAFREPAAFTAHLEHQHSKGVKPRQIPMLLSAWRRKAPLKIPACPLCCFESDDQNTLLDHTAEHIHSFSLRSLPWAPREGLEEEDDYEGDATYFKLYPYFEVNSCQSEPSSGSPGVSSLADTDLGSIAGSDSRESANYMHEQQQQLTEDLLDQVPRDILGQTGMSDWLEMLGNDAENPNPSPMAFNPPDSLNHHVRPQNPSKEFSHAYSSPPGDTQALSQFIYPPRAYADEVDDESAEGVWGYLIPLDDSVSSPVVLRQRDGCAGRDEPVNDKSSKTRVPGGYLFGRDPECDLVINSPTISNRHFLLFSEKRMGNVFAMLADLSSNGTFVNDTVVGRNKHRELEDGDEVSVLNEARFVFRYPRTRDTSGFRHQYRNLQQLSKGHFATVYLCADRTTGKQYAVKVFEKRRGDSQEISILMSLNHPNLLCLKDIIDETDGAYLILELAPEGDLFNFIVRKQKLSEAETRYIFRQLFGGLKYLHDRGIVHRDIKPENILVADKKPTVKLGGFGFATIIGEDSFATTLCGTPSYVAPEILEESRARRYTKAVDIWSLGVVLYICLCGFPPFSDELYTKENPYSLSEQIKTGRFDYPSPYWDSVDDPALDLIDKMLTVDVEKRITADECLEHPWLTENYPSVNDSTDGLTDALDKLNFPKRKLERKRTMLINVNDVHFSEHAEGSTPVEVHNKNDAGN